MVTIKKGLYIVLQTLQFTLWYGSISVVAIIGLFFVFFVFANPVNDTISITNYAFGIVAALSSISFGYSRCLEDKEIQNKIRYCGERFLHSAILFLLASIMKYFTLQDNVQSMSSDIYILSFFVSFVSVFPMALFLSSLINFIVAIRDLSSILYSMRNPSQDIRKFI